MVQNLNGAKIKIFIDGVELLKSYTFNNYEDTLKSYTRKRARIIFNTSFTGKTILVNYELAPTC